MAAFQSAVDQGADMVELDLHRTSDGAIVILHDPTLERLWGIDRAIGEMELAEVRSIDQDGDRIPMFAEVLHSFDIRIMVDFTGDEVVEGALSDVRAADAMDRSLFVTGHVPALRHLRSLSPDARIGLTWIEPDPPPVALLHELGAEFWNPMFRLAKPPHVAAVHQLGLQVSAWTVDEPRHMERMVEAGVDAIVSNRISDLLQFLSTRP